MDTDSGSSVNFTYPKNFRVTSELSYEKWCRYTTQNSHSDSAYSSTFSNSSNRIDSYLTSSDDSLDNELYDADDEIEGITERVDAAGDKMYQAYANNLRNGSEADNVFCLSQSTLGDERTAYLLDRAMDIIKNRPKLSERLYIDDDSDACFCESDYDVVDLDKDFGLKRNNDSFPAINITFRQYGSPDDGIVEIIATSKKKQFGKVKSIPHIRFPLRTRKSNPCKRTSLYPNRTDSYRLRSSSLNWFSSTESEDVYPRVHKKRNSVDQYENEAERRRYGTSTTRQPVRCTEYTMVDDSRLGRFQICHMVENPLKR